MEKINIRLIFLSYTSGEFIFNFWGVFRSCTSWMFEMFRCTATLFFIVHFSVGLFCKFLLKKLAFCIIIQSHELRYPTSVTPSVNSGTMTFFVSGHFFLLTNHVYLSWFCQRTNSVSWRYNYTCLLMTSQGTWSWI